MTDKKTHALRLLAVEKLIKARMKAASDEARAELLGEMNPKDRLSITTDTGLDIGTASKTLPDRKRGTGIKVTDPAAFSAWLDENDHDNPARQTVLIEFPEWFVGEKNLESIISRNGGELPDGVEDTTEPGEPYLTIRQTEAQANALAYALAETPLIEIIRPLLTDGSEK